MRCVVCGEKFSLVPPAEPCACGAGLTQVEAWEDPERLARAKAAWADGFIADEGIGDRDPGDMADRDYEDAQSEE